MRTDLVQVDRVHLAPAGMGNWQITFQSLGPITCRIVSRGMMGGVLGGGRSHTVRDLDDITPFALRNPRQSHVLGQLFEKSLSLPHADPLSQFSRDSPTARRSDDVNAVQVAVVVRLRLPPSLLNIPRQD
ncbi:hypothetical protein CC2G_005277 [Coprinopsis cinerea AmutBmut pab1-1]|nr:hypothetical protein CC2G_005277 [Coprinopsis cinerea AmutBmut pab1-1]